MNRLSFAILSALALCAVLPQGALADPRTWEGSASSDWFDAANWAENAIPVAGDDVTIATGTALLTNATPALASLTLTGTLVFSNWNTTLSATNVAIGNDGVMTLPPAYTNAVMSNNVVVVCSNLTIATDGMIDVSGKGYAGAVSPLVNGHGPGFGQGTGIYGTGGGYGGFSWDGRAKGGRTYGDAAAPLHPGSGGGRGNTGSGGAGGGAVRIEASGTVTVDGTISADGATGSYSGGGGSGGGSGGGVYVRCRQFAGDGGVITAGGGRGRWENGISSPGGGGGRISVQYDTSAQTGVPNVRLLASRGWSADGFGVPRLPSADLGTVALPDAAFLTETLTHHGEFVIPGFASWSPPSLLVSNGCVRFPADGFALSVAGDIRVDGTGAILELGGTVRHFETAAIIYTPIRSSGLQAPVATCGGDLVVTNGGNLTLYAAATNGSGAAGALLDVAGGIVVGAASTLSLQAHPLNGGAPRVKADRVAVLAGGAIEAVGRGFAGGTNRSDGFGPGRSFYDNQRVSYPSGAAHGGAGGGSFTLPRQGRGLPYGSAQAPLLPGSGSSGHAADKGGAGGGVVRIVASGELRIDGLIAADGGVGLGLGGGVGGGAGGSVYLTCDRISGSGGVISAVGGLHSVGNHHGDGGGGRIALDYNPASQTVAPDIRLTAAPGGLTATACYPHRGQPGTVWLPDTRFLTETVGHQGELIIPGFTRWETDRLTVSNGWLRLPQEGFALAVTNDLRVTGVNAALEIGGSEVNTNFWHRDDYTWPEGMTEFWHARMGGTQPAAVTVGGDLVLTNGGGLALYASPTNAVTKPAGLCLDVAGTFTVANGSWFAPYAHATNGGPVRVRARNVSILAGGFIDASGKGFVGNPLATKGFGQGAGAGDNHSGTGGGYGGWGGRSYNFPVGGAPYGIERWPTDAGSAGGRGGTAPGGAGGGMVWLEADNRLSVGGTIAANGDGGTGGGAGGGIYLTARQFEGAATGLLTATGGRGAMWCGGGGGGRIAVCYRRDLSQAPVSCLVDAGLGSGVTGGNGGNYTGTVGVVNFYLLPPSGTTVVVH